MKEKIIDGVDVAGCRSYKHNAENIGWSICLSKDEEHYHSNNPLCCEKKDCLYKQLKRLEQSHNKLYDDLLEVVKLYLSDFTGYDEKEQCFNIVLVVKELLGQLEQENKNLKEEFASFMNGDYCAESCKKMNNAFQDVHKAILKENEELKQEKVALQKLITEARGE